MGFRYKPLTRVISLTVLLFFSWSFAGGLDIAYAIKSSDQQSAISNQQNSQKSSGSNQKSKTQKSEEKFQKVIEDIEKTLANTATDTDTKKSKLKTKKSEVETLDVEIKKQFNDTEEFLKKKGLPPEILERHYKFVKHYEDNLKELNDNLAAIDKSRTKSETDASISRAKSHLEKVKVPSSHVPLDPNKLPHRTAEPVWIEPRTSPEQFLKDSQKSLVNSHQSKQILVASNGSLKGLINEKATPPYSSPYQGEDGRGGTMQIALADPPTDADLAETIEVKFTPAIQAKAAELGHSPVKIYNWVRNNIEFVPTYGSIQGADMCLQTKLCNDTDTANLLIALLRVSGIHAKYAYGTIELPIEKVKNWVGGFTDSNAALTFIASGGIPVTGLSSGGTISEVRMEHIWTEAYIPYGNYRGSMKDDSIKTWIPMDASYKQYTYTSGIDLTVAVPFDQDDYLSQPQEQNPIHYYQTKIQEYLAVNMPDTSIVDVKGTKEIKQENYHFLSPTLPYQTVTVLIKMSSVPATIRHSVVFTITDPYDSQGASLTLYAPELAGKRITLSYIPASSTDDALISFYGGYVFDVPAYLLNLKAVLKVDGNIKLTGSPTTMGSEQSLTLVLSKASGSATAVNKRLIAGTYYGMVIDLQGIDESILGARNSNLIANVLSGTGSNDDLIGEHLHALATTYFMANDKVYKAGARLFNVAFARTLSEGIVSLPLDVSYIFDIPNKVVPSGIEVDVAMDRTVSIARDGNKTKERVYIDIAGLTGSYHEHEVFEKIDGFVSVSAVKAIQIASSNGIAIYSIDSTNINQLLPLTQVDADTKVDIQNAVNAGKVVTLPQMEIKINDWVGTGYIIKDPATGAGAYMIAGGLGGGRNIDIFAQWETFKKFYWKPLEWFSALMDWGIGNNIAYSAEVENGEGGLSEEEIEQKILNGALVCKGMGYLEVGTCTGLVGRAYIAAGIDLVALARKHGVNDNVYSAPSLYALANTLKINSSVRQTNNPLIGDVIFWNYTYDRNGNCLLADDKQPTHVGIVSKVDIDGQGTITYIHAGSTGVSASSKNKMNVDMPSDRTKNAVLRGAPKNGCPSDGGIKLSGELFSGFGTIRNQ